MLENTSEAIPGLVNQFELVNGTVWAKLFISNFDFSA